MRQSSNLRWIDRYVVRPHVIHKLIATGEYGTRANPWYRKWADTPGYKQPRNAWPWRIRVDFQWNRHSITVGLLYYSYDHMPKSPQFGFGVYFFDAGDGWIESVAT